MNSPSANIKLSPLHGKIVNSYYLETPVDVDWYFNDCQVTGWSRLNTLILMLRRNQ